MVSGNGRYVAFRSSASNLVAGDGNGFDDVFVHDRFLHTTECVSVDLAGLPGNAPSGLFGVAISADGRCVAFQSDASNLVAGDTNNMRDIFVRDRANGTTELVNVDSLGNQANSHSRFPSISADGRFVAYTSAASNLGPDTNMVADVFLRDRLLYTTERISQDVFGGDADLGSQYTALSADGRFVAFDSLATNLVAGDTNAAGDVFVRDRLLGTTERVSVASSGQQADLASSRPSICADGSRVAFESGATNLVAGDSNGCADVFVRERPAGTTARASVASAGAQGTGPSSGAWISADGRCVAFESAAANLVAGDSNGFKDVFLRELAGGTTSCVAQGDGPSSGASLSSDSSLVGFSSFATNLVLADTNALPDHFAHDRGTGSPGSDLCQAGTGGVSACPCANPPQSAPRGCDNSSATGGARLSSSGQNSLVADTLLFVTDGERPSATSILLQGSAEAASGLLFGQGVRCAAGTLKRLYVKTASNGSISAPGPGDLPVSAQSAALNHPIAAGTSRWYAVYYRDPIVVGGCSAFFTFNITQTQRVDWGP